ncbi:MAG: hypothetical protein O7B25_10055 [Gammaproteobacteria bacterium]|nr:hypothetical protein [Gammaproteobacteria bacterium]
MANPKSGGSVLLAEHHSALKVLHTLLADATAAFPNALGAAELPATPQAFRSIYPDVLPRFEAARLASQERYQIAHHLMTALQQYIFWQDDSGQRPLHEALTEPAAPLSLEMHAFDGEAGWQPSLVYQGERWDAARLAEFGALLVDRGVMTPDAGAALAWVSEEVLDAGTLRLAGRKIAVLGGGAEMAPTRFWLEAGADVLWLDTSPPPRSWWEFPGMSGRLYWPAGNADLLVKPREVLATLNAFADGTPLDLGLYAYAPGQARELRLAASMNALVNALAPELVASVTMLISPTTPAALSPHDLAAMRARIEARPAWETICARFMLLGRGGGSVAVGDAATNRSVVAIQGASYQAAQYLGKIMMAECWAQHGPLGLAERNPLRVSANTAAITRTRSLARPVFAAAFGGAAAFGIETLAPRQSRRLNGLLAIRDWLHPTLPSPGAVRVHGGIHTLPYPLGSALRVAAVIGFARSPRLLRGLIAK